MFSSLFFISISILNNYDNEILKVLTEAGSAGISVQKVSRHVFNAFNSFFNPVQYQDVHDYVLQYLQRNSKSAISLITRTDTRGVYKLNLDNQESRQLMLQFAEDRTADDADEASQSTPIDLSLSLF